MDFTREEEETLRGIIEEGATIQQLVSEKKASIVAEEKAKKDEAEAVKKKEAATKFGYRRLNDGYDNGQYKEKGFTVFLPTPMPKSATQGSRKVGSDRNTAPQWVQVKGARDEFAPES